MNMEIDTYGNVDSLYYVMQGVASFMGSGTWTGLIKYSLLSGLLIWTVAAVGRKGTEIFRWFAGAMFMTQVLLLPVENVFITDVNNVQPTREVDHVPVYLAAVAQSFTLISRVLTESYETIFSVPDTLTLRKGDVGFGVSVLKKVNQAEVTDPGLHADLMQFFKECTVYDIQDGAIDPHTIMSGTDPFNTIFTSTSPARYVTTNTLTANPTTDTCLATGTLLLIRVQDAEQSAEQIYGSEMYPEISDSSLARADFVNAIGDSYGFILQSSQNASSALRQAMFNNVWRQAGAELPAMLNDPARVAEVNALISSAQAATATNGSLSSMAILAKDTLPTVRNYAEAIIYAVFPVILVMCLISGGDGAKRILGAYAKTVAWVSLWPMMFAVINGLSLIHLSHQMRSMSLQAGVPFGMAAKFGSTLIDEQALLGWMVLIAPVFAWGLINIVTVGVVGAFNAINGAVTGAAQQIGGQQAQGDENIGNVHMDSSSIDNQTRNVTSANKMDTTMQQRWGSQSIDAGTGSSFTNFGNGQIARTDTQNSLGFAANSQTSVEKSVGADASTGISANKVDSQFGGHEKIASGGRTTSTSQDRGETQRFGDEATTGTRGSIGQSGGRRASNDQQYAVDQTHATQGTTSVGGKVSGALGGFFEKSFGDEAPAGPASASNGPAGGGGANGKPGAANPAANAPAFSQAEEDKLAQKAQALGKSPAEVQAVRDKYRSQVRALDYATGGGTGRGRAGGRLGGDIGIEGGYTKTWQNSDAEKFADQHSSVGSYGEEDHFAKDGALTHMDATGSESGQHARNERSASLVDQTSAGQRNAADLSRTMEWRQRGSTQTVTRVDTSQNLMTPDNLQRVAARNGISYSRLMTLPESDLARMVQEDASMRDLVTKNATLPSKARDGSALPGKAQDVIRQNQSDRGAVGTDVSAAFAGYSRGIGPADTTPLDVKTPMPEVVNDAQKRVATMKQRVADDAASPIKQVRDHVDPTTDNKALMTPERAPGRPLASTQVAGPSQAPTSTPSMGVWAGDRAVHPTSPRARDASTTAVDKFLHPEAPANGPTLDAARRLGEGGMSTTGSALTPGANSPRDSADAGRGTLATASPAPAKDGATKSGAPMANTGNPLGTSAARGGPANGGSTSTRLSALSESNFKIVPLDGVTDSARNSHIARPPAGHSPMSVADSPVSGRPSTGVPNGATVGTSAPVSSSAEPDVTSLQPKTSAASNSNSAAERTASVERSMAAPLDGTFGSATVVPAGISVVPSISAARTDTSPHTDLPVAVSNPSRGPSEPITGAQSTTDVRTVAKPNHTSGDVHAGESAASKAATPSSIDVDAAAIAGPGTSPSALASMSKLGGADAGRATLNMPSVAQKPGNADSNDQ